MLKLYKTLLTVSSRASHGACTQSIVLPAGKLYSHRTCLYCLGFHRTFSSALGDDKSSADFKTKNQTKDATENEATSRTFAKTANDVPPIETIVKVVPKSSHQHEHPHQRIERHRKKIDYSKKSLANNYVTPLRAMYEYLLKPSDLEGLRKTLRRSPYDDKPMTVHLRSDVEAKAIEVWGSLENLQKELKSRRDPRHTSGQEYSIIKRAIREYRNLLRSSGQNETPFIFQPYGRKPDEKQTMMKTGTGRVVLLAVAINSANFLFKAAAWLYTGSHSMFSEMIHSLADTCNQLILAWGVHTSIKRPDPGHPYGYSNMRYVSSLISGVGIFCFGTGLSVYHGIKGLISPTEIESMYWAFFILGGAAVSEGGTLLVAFEEIKRKANLTGVSFMTYVWRGEDPNVNVVLLEDFAAVIGVGIAAMCMGITAYTGNPTADAVGSLMIGGLLGAVASFIIYTNVTALVGRSIPPGRQDSICKELENDVVIRAIHDVKATDLGGSMVRFKAEVDFDGRAITQSYLDLIDLETVLKELKNIQTLEELEAFMVKHGENTIDRLGIEIDRIEAEMKKRHPEIRHVDLEVL